MTSLAGSSLAGSAVEGETKGASLAGAAVEGETKTTTTTVVRRTSIINRNDLSEEECQIINLLRTNLGDDLPLLARNDLTLHRFLVAREWHIEDTEKMLREHLDWRKERFPIPRSIWQLDKLFANGAIFPHGYDKEGRPV